jgi:microcystin degradation protein MlrC
LVDCRIIGFYPTFDLPMKDVVAAFREVSGKGPIVTAELAHGFPWADVADLGTRVLVYADGDAGAAAAEAERLAALIYRQREALTPVIPDIGASLDKARGLNGRTVLGDFADNPGGGAPGDSTFFLHALIDRGVDDAVIGAFWDPFAAATCADAGVGAVLPLRLGGKCGTMSGEPVDLEVEVMGVREIHSQGVFGERQPMGRSVWVRSGGIDIIICSVRTQVFEPDAFTGLGVPLEGRRLVIVKSSNHYRAGFGPVADDLWHVASPGAMSLDFARLPYTKVASTMYPMTRDPWAAQGAPKARTFAVRSH